jgi:hypothetical protein
LLAIRPREYLVPLVRTSRRLGPGSWVQPRRPGTDAERGKKKSSLRGEPACGWVWLKAGCEGGEADWRQRFVILDGFAGCRPLCLFSLSLSLSLSLCLSLLPSLCLPPYRDGRPAPVNSRVDTNIAGRWCGAGELVWCLSSKGSVQGLSDGRGWEEDGTRGRACRYRQSCTTVCRISVPHCTGRVGLAPVGASWDQGRRPDPGSNGTLSQPSDPEARQRHETRGGRIAQ